MEGTIEPSAVSLANPRNPYPPGTPDYVLYERYLDGKISYQEFLKLFVEARGGTFEEWVKKQSSEELKRLSLAKPSVGVKLLPIALIAAGVIGLLVYKGRNPIFIPILLGIAAAVGAYLTWRAGRGVETGVQKSIVPLLIVLVIAGLVFWRLRG